jgi:3-(3-hydroxy-phenyl)propionate hydroxylase
MPEAENFDVLIVGAGPAGLATANYLGMYGVRVLVVERNAGTVEEPRAVSIDDETLRSMQTLGLDGPIVAKTVPGYGARYHSPGQKEFARIQPTTREFGHPRRSGFRQPEFEAELLTGLDKHQTVEVRFGHSFENLQQDDDGVTVDILDPAGHHITVLAGLLAACDGGRSAVRKELGVALAGSSFNERWLVIDCVNDLDETPASIAYCDHRRPAITIPGPGRTRRWEFLLKRDEDDEDLLRDEKIRELLAPYIGDRDVEIIRKLVYTFHARIADHWRVGRVFLLGDAAHLTPPYAGQGLNSGQRDAANFAWKAAAVVKGRSGILLMDTYEAERRDHAWSLIRMAIQIGWVMVPRNWVHTYGQIAFFKLAGIIPPVRDYFVGMKFKPVPRFRDGFLCADELRARDTLVGRMLPQPDVIDEAGQLRKLDDVLGPGFALLSVGPANPDALLALEHALWARLDANRVVLSAAQIADSDVAGCRVVQAKGGGLPPRFAKYAGKILLVRPDRYVAAAFTTAEAVDIADRLSALMD